jgi:hypothetical protein
MGIDISSYTYPNRVKNRWVLSIEYPLPSLGREVVRGITICKHSGVGPLRKSRCKLEVL